jgi:hypothetical protein
VLSTKKVGGWHQVDALQTQEIIRENRCKKDVDAIPDFRYTVCMVDGDTNNGGSMSEHMCDVCNENPAMSYNEKQGAVCSDCRLFDSDGNCACDDSACNFCHPVLDCDDSDDAYALASAGFGTDEDYGCYDSGDF